jgi:hypothetical protein
LRYYFIDNDKQVYCEDCVYGKDMIEYICYKKGNMPQPCKTCWPYDFPDSRGTNLRVNYVEGRDKIMLDNKGKVCKNCKKGTYQETKITDDWDGVLHCTECGHQVARWEELHNKVVVPKIFDKYV